MSIPSEVYHTVEFPSAAFSSRVSFLHVQNFRQHPNCYCHLSLVLSNIMTTRSKRRMSLLLFDVFETTNES